MYTHKYTCIYVFCIYIYLCMYICIMYMCVYIHRFFLRLSWDFAHVRGQFCEFILQGRCSFLSDIQGLGHH